MTRLFVPVTLAAAPGLLDAGAAGTAGWAVTPAFAAYVGAADEEELDHLALTAAAQSSLELIDDEDVPRRAVLVVDVEVADRPGGDPGEKVTTAPWRRRQVLAFYLDDEAAESAVVAARREGADGPAAEALLDHEPGWYATQEVAALAATLTHR